MAAVIEKRGWVMVKKRVFRWASGLVIGGAGIAGGLIVALPAGAVTPTPTAPPTARVVPITPPTPAPITTLSPRCRFSVSQDFTFNPLTGTFHNVNVPAIICNFPSGVRVYSLER